MMSFWKQLWHVPRWWQAAPDQLESTDSIDGEEGAFPWEGYCIAPRCFDSPERQAAPQEMEGGQPAHLPIKVYRLPLRHKVPGMVRQPGSLWTSKQQEYLLGVAALLLEERIACCQVSLGQPDAWAVAPPCWAAYVQKPSC